MQTAATAVHHLLDRAFAGRREIRKEDLLRAAAAEDLGADALTVIRELPDLPYTREGLHVALEDSVREREQAREAGMDAHAEPGWRPESVRRHPNR